MIQWMFFSRSTRATPLALSVVAAFETVAAHIDSATHDLPSNDVLALAAPHLTAAGFTVEVGKKADQKINVPASFAIAARPAATFGVPVTGRRRSRWQRK